MKSSKADDMFKRQNTPASRPKVGQQEPENFLESTVINQNIEPNEHRQNLIVMSSKKRMMFEEAMRITEIQIPSLQKTDK